jgi:hypothetical protein
MPKIRTVAAAVLAGSLSGCFPREFVSDGVPDGQRPGTETGEPLDLPEGEVEAHPDTDDTGGGEGDTGSMTTELLVEAISPSEGTTAGGQAVELIGGPFDQTVVVELCGRSAVVTAVAEGSLVFETPPSLAGQCDLRVSTEDAEGERLNAYTYWEDAGGQVIALASWTRTDLANPAHWTTAPDPKLRVDAAVVTAREVALEDFYTSGRDSCQRTDGDSRQAQWSALGSVNAGPNVVSGSVGAPVDVPWDPNLGFYEGFLDAELYEPGQSLFLNYSESTIYPAFEAAPTYQAPSPFRVTLPDVHGASAPWAHSYNLDIGWTGGAADYVGIDIWSLSTSQRVRCAVEDDGFFEVPASLLSDFPQDWAELVVTRYETDDVVMEFNDGLVRSQVGYALTGVVYLVQ